MTGRMGSDRDRANTASSRPSNDVAVPAAPGKTTRVQRRYRASIAPARSPDDTTIRSIAAGGVSGSAESLPHLDVIQRSFGRHDVTGVSAHVGGNAADAADQLEAMAYATGTHVAFASPPSLALSAHEAAHVVQQRGGVQMSGALSSPDDHWERHADAVSDAVVRGESAEPLLDAALTGSGPVTDTISRYKKKLSLGTIRGSLEINGIAMARPDSGAPKLVPITGPALNMKLAAKTSGVISVTAGGKYVVQNIASTIFGKYSFTTEFHYKVDGDGKIEVDKDDIDVPERSHESVNDNPLGDDYGMSIAAGTNGTSYLKHSLAVVEGNSGISVGVGPLGLKVSGTGSKSSGTSFKINLSAEPLPKPKKPDPPDKPEPPENPEPPKKPKPLPVLPAPLHIYFAREGDKTPDDPSVKRLRAWAKALTPEQVAAFNERRYRITCFGHASKTGREGKNQNLADTRARFARATILGGAPGLEGYAIVARGIGEDVASKDPKSPNKEHRRVDVLPMIHKL